ncbi:hypothetical protein PYCC9005_000050 [Savitreella phatthalungensis]
MAPQPDQKDHGVLGPQTDLPTEQMWKALVDKIRHPDLYLPGIVAVSWRNSDDGSVYREMTVEMPTTTAVMIEDIYAIKEQYRIEFRIRDSPYNVVNQYHPDKKAIEYFVEEKETHKNVGWWNWPNAREGTYSHISGQYERAKLL